MPGSWTLLDTSVMLCRQGVGGSSLSSSTQVRRKFRTSEQSPKAAYRTKVQPWRARSGTEGPRVGSQHPADKRPRRSEFSRRQRAAATPRFSAQKGHHHRGYQWLIRMRLVVQVHLGPPRSQLCSSLRSRGVRSATPTVDPLPTRAGGPVRRMGGAGVG
jgi:hypothetical protein